MIEPPTPEADESGYECPPEMRLMQAVVVDAVIAALARKSSKSREAARGWILDTSEAFQTVCDCAGLDADYIRRNTRKRLACGDLLHRAPKLHRKSAH